MKILIPTAKEMNTDLPSIEAIPLKPESQAVLDALALYSASQLESFYKVSAEKAAEEFQNIQALKRQTAQHYPALKLFDGLMYRNIKRDKLTEAEQDYLENHVFITSALYGVVPALSLMAPHRLDFLMKLKVAGKTLKSHWKAVYDEALKKEEVIFSLLSSEFETVFSKEIRFNRKSSTNCGGSTSLELCWICLSRRFVTTTGIGFCKGSIEIRYFVFGNMYHQLF